LDRCPEPDIQRAPVVFEVALFNRLTLSGRFGDQRAAALGHAASFPGARLPAC
jgi:hypothetical protein